MLKSRLLLVPFVFALLLVFGACNSSVPPASSRAEEPVLSAGGPQGSAVGDGLDSPPEPEESFLEQYDSGAGTEQEELSAPEPASAVGQASAPASTLPDDGGSEAEQGAVNQSELSEASTSERSDGMIAVTVTIGGEPFAALCYDNEATRTLVAQMPLTVTMSDLNRNEKFCHFPENLHTLPAESPPTIYAGEIMCWSGNSLVLFYDTFPNSYGGYVRIGYLEDTTGLAAAVGSGSVAVTFSTAN